jgi:hypothetical protein
MEHARIDISRDLDGEAVVLACVDLREEELSASAHAIGAVIRERFQSAEMSADDVIELRELTALCDEVGEPAGGIRTVVMSPARLSAYRHALTMFVESRDEAEWLREEDREPLAISRSLLWPLEDLGAEAIRAALDPSAAQRPC